MRRIYTSCVSAILVACSGSAPSKTEPAPMSGSAEPAASATACVVRGKDPDPVHGDSPPRADSITIAGDEVKLCWNAGPARTCWRIDVANQVFMAQPVTSDAPGNDTPRFVQRSHATATPRADGTISLCAPGGSPCRSFANPGPTQQPEWVGVSDDLATIAIPDGAVLCIYDVARARVRTTIQGWPDSPMPDNRFVYPPIFASPSRMIVWYSWTPVSEQGRIFDMSGKQLAIVGGKGFAALGPDLDSWLVQGTEWAIKGEGNTLVTVDVQDPRVTSTYDLSDLLAQPRPPKDSDTGILDVLAVAGTAKRLIIVTDENPVTIGVLDRATKKLVKIEPPRCRPRLALRHSGSGST
jgi:hypothetical protein